MPHRHIDRDLLVAIAAAALLGFATAASAEGDRYVDRTLGFSFSKPRFEPSTAPGATTVAITLSDAQSGPFAPNVNLVVHNIETTLEAYQRKQLEELQTVGWEVVEQRLTTLDGEPALRTHARGRVQGQELEFLGMAMVRAEAKQTIVLTCTAAATQFSDYKDEFDRVVASFALEP